MSVLRAVGTTRYSSTWPDEGGKEGAESVEEEMERWSRKTARRTRMKAEVDLVGTTMCLSLACRSIFASLLQKGVLRDDEPAHLEIAQGVQAR